MANPFAGNPLTTREHVKAAFESLYDPLRPFFSPGGARVKLGSSGALFSEECEQLEGFARPLYGIVPFCLGSGRFDDWELYRGGIEHGTDPAHPEFWGISGTGQRMVEMAALGFALSFVSEKVWQPLSDKAKDNLTAWLSRINEHELPDNNWQFFRVIVNLGLQTVGRGYDERANQLSLDAIERHYKRDGYYYDGAPGRVDYYVPWAYHTYGLIYASSPLARPEVARRYRQRARQFAGRYEYWFDSRGAAIPFGRSLTYRFAQGAFWGALAFADEEALSWARLKGLYLRHLRYWKTQAISGRDGVLSLGYAYENLHACEPYSSACSPYWCMKYFLALAAPEEHGFWQAEEESSEQFEAELERIRAEPVAGMIFQRDAAHSLLLSAGQDETRFVNTQAKYGKFAYSSRFGFSIAPPELVPEHGVHDSMLALREKTGPWRVRVRTLESFIDERTVYSRWKPWDDVEVETLLVACGMPWHVRIHRIRSSRGLFSAEQGFALGLDGRESAWFEHEYNLERSGICARTGFGTSGIVDLAKGRQADLQRALPNTSLLWPRTVIPRLSSELDPGVSVLACAVIASHRGDTDVFRSCPQLQDEWLERFDRARVLL